MEGASGRYAIIVAGGSGSRMNNPVPKQFLKLNGKPLLMHTIGKFTEADPGIKIIIVLPENQLKHWKELCSEYNFHCDSCITTGGETRFDSVKNGLAQIKDNYAIVGVHDAARPLVNTKTIITAYKAAEMYGNAVPAVAMNDSIRQIDSTKNIALDRSKYCKVQTPQCFSVELLKKLTSRSINTLLPMMQL